ncbi:aspartic proteinase CDR1-like [Salvia splendens]|uniref:aspartic proteinase CDR1-like n=1 Tax=Salvia splendens TaxID=180675 RepID=UPI001C25A0DF|nr:aspartic proteinase CDR1-like [Salvia splendens]
MQPLHHCFKQNDLVFEPKKSSSYKPISKKHPLAKSFQCSFFGSGCSYSTSYYSGQFSKGPAATETFTFDSSLKRPASVKNLVFGGILGMDKAPMSLPRQLGASIKNRFSYCLSPTTGSYIRFGDEAVIQGRNGQRTPIVETSNNRSATNYALPLMDLSINGKRLGARFPEGIYIDSGSSLSLLETSVFVGTRPNLPTMVFHFKGADLAPNLFVFLEKNVFCFMALGVKNYNWFFEILTRYINKIRVHFYSNISRNINLMENE